MEQCFVIFRGWLDTVWMFLLQNSGKRGAFRYRLLFLFGKREEVHVVFVCHHEHCWWRSSRSHLYLSLPPLVVVCVPCDGTYMTCCFLLYRGDVVLKMYRRGGHDQDEAHHSDCPLVAGVRQFKCVSRPVTDVTKHQWRRRSFQQLLLLKTGSSSTLCH